MALPSAMSTSVSSSPPSTASTSPARTTSIQNAHAKILSGFCVLFSEFQHEKAKEYLDRERSSVRTSNQQKWNAFYNHLGQMTFAEKQYLDLAFLQARGFLRKDNNLKTQLESMHQDLLKLESSVIGDPDDEFPKIIAQIRSFISTRLNLIDFYTFACNMGTTKNIMDFPELLTRLYSLKKSFESSMTSVIVEPLKRLLTQESGILIGYIEALDIIGHYKMCPSIIKITDARSHLKEWHKFIQNAKESKKLSFLSNALFGQHHDPHLYLWMTRLSKRVTEKYSLYFDAILAETINNPAVHKANRAKLDTDYVAKLQIFQRKVNASRVIIVFDASNEPNYRGPDHDPLPPGENSENGSGDHREEDAEDEEGALTGIDLFPCVFMSPDSECKEVWPSVVMVIMNSVSELDNGGLNHVAQFHDSRNEVTFYLSRIDPLVTFVVLFDGLRPEVEQNLIPSIKEICIELKCTTIFAGLKPGSR